MFLTFLLKCLFLFAKQSNLELNQISLSNSKYELVQLWRAKYSYKYRLATVFRISIFRIIPVRSESRSNNEQTLFEFSTSIFLFLGIGGIVPPPPLICQLCPSRIPGTSQRRYRSKEHAFSRSAPLKFEYLMDYARGSHIHRVSMFVHIESGGMTVVAFCMELSSENSVSTESHKETWRLLYYPRSIVATRLVCR